MALSHPFVLYTSYHTATTILVAAAAALHLGTRNPVLRPIRSVISHHHHSVGPVLAVTTTTTAAKSRKAICNYRPSHLQDDGGSEPSGG